ncbi:hypothetical protein QJS04_geneDACA019732 [Acorus gramineus]|uniref:CCHC-type domain-containing protein n=1 Tax=Acorus gramineus TaxID=55184 RepID=A0AAV9BVK2_ACOGR|nr:hypothetical protein QJS04_geneDACA019732 [Acorus gramineus]
MTEEKRIRDPNENKRRMHRCTRCKEFGHHRNSCKNPMAESSDQHDFTESDQHNPIGDRGDTKNEEGQSSIFREPQITPVGAPNPGARINLINVTVNNGDFSSQGSIDGCSGTSVRMEGINIQTHMGGLSMHVDCISAQSCPEQSTSQHVTNSTREREKRGRSLGVEKRLPGGRRCGAIAKQSSKRR